MSKQKYQKPSYDIPFEFGAGTRLLTWVIALMALLSSLSLAGYFLVSQISEHWVTDISSHLTIEISPPMTATQNPDELQRVDQTLMQRQIDDTLSLLLDHENILSAQRVPQKELNKILGTWLENDADLSLLPIPVLIDITLVDTHNIEASVQDLKSIINQQLPGVTLNDHKGWLSDFISFLHFWEFNLIGLAATMFILAVFAIIAVVRARISIHIDDVKLIHIIGAEDRYIAKQFQKNATAHITKGTLSGCIIAITLVYISLAKINIIQSNLLPHFDLSAFQWGLLVTLPLISGIVLAHFTAYKTAMTELNKLP